jgi:hypothetical protein
VSKARAAGLVLAALSATSAWAEPPCARRGRDAVFEAPDGARLRPTPARRSAKLTYTSAACVERALRCAAVERGLDCLDDGQPAALVCLHLWATTGACRVDALARHLGEEPDAPVVKETLARFRQAVGRQTPEAQARSRAQHLATASLVVELRRASAGRCAVTLTEVSGAARGAPQTFTETARGALAASLSGLPGLRCARKDVRAAEPLGGRGPAEAPRSSPSPEALPSEAPLLDP